MQNFFSFQKLGFFLHFSDFRYLPHLRKYSVAKDAYPKVVSQLDGDETWIKRIRLNPTLHKTSTERFARYALFFSYLGEKYYGSQRLLQSVHPTVDDTILTAIKKSRYIIEDCYDPARHYSFQAVSRTDRGVSAVCQIISLLIDYDDNFINAVNKNLPEDIRLWKLVKTPRRIMLRFWCDCRTYSYLIPTFAFSPLDRISNVNYRICKDQLMALQDVLNCFKGANFYHNFTLKGEPFSHTSRRNIREAYHSDPFIRDGIEWISITLTGDSFMQLQIRKMMGLSIAICRGLVPKDMIKTAFTEKAIRVPSAPALGLVLEKQHFNNYNKKFTGHESISYEDIAENLTKFKDNVIIRNIINKEKRENVTLAYLREVVHHNYVYYPEGEDVLKSGLGSARRNLHTAQNNEGYKMM